MKVTKEMRAAEVAIAFAMGKTVASGGKLTPHTWGVDIVRVYDGELPSACTVEAQGGCFCAVGAYLNNTRPVFGLEFGFYEAAAQSLNVPLPWVVGVVRGFDCKEKNKYAMHPESRAGYAAGRRFRKLAGL